MSTTMGDNGDEVEAKEQRCIKCGYHWEYSGELWHTTCPRCNCKTPTWRNDEYADEVTI